MYFKVMSLRCKVYLFSFKFEKDILKICFKTDRQTDRQIL